MTKQIITWQLVPQEQALRACRLYHLGWHQFIANHEARHEQDALRIVDQWNRDWPARRQAIAYRARGSNEADARANLASEIEKFKAREKTDLDALITDAAEEFHVECGSPHDCQACRPSAQRARRAAGQVQAEDIGTVTCGDVCCGSCQVCSDAGTCECACTLDCYNRTIGPCLIQAIERQDVADARCEEDADECVSGCLPDGDDCRNACWDEEDSCTDAAEETVLNESRDCDQLYPCCSEEHICDGGSVTRRPVSTRPS